LPRIRHENSEGGILGSFGSDSRRGTDHC
jgi:hypothetical protein